MLTQFVKVSFQNQCKKVFFARQTGLYNLLLQSNRKASSKDKIVDDDNSNEPIKYSTSKASTWLASQTRHPLPERHPYESDVITISLMIFMIYFFILREENDIDLSLNKPLLELVPKIVSGIDNENVVSKKL
ncbi:uncharacterized protein LOC122632082 [Vespula pensylvanica]|uniref:uncharacterized protein LOC122632082 n=1 Tax=Vespula pensylvanica TaxID=30213 RepID=UPI001CB9FD70|nr:uncharacterized protein LOC122632082 [Vespula pensylvanica]